MRKQLLLFLSCILTVSSWAATGGPDGYGYSFKDQAESGGPAYEWIDISTSGQAVVLGGVNSASTSAGPEGIGAFLN